MLTHSGCRALLSEFHDSRGRPLSDQLSALNVDAPGYLRLLLFRDGSTAEPCTKDQLTFAFTSPRSRVVFVCGRRFVRVWRESAQRAQAGIIHEALHTLGLHEDSPSSRAITQRVLALCVR